MRAFPSEAHALKLTEQQLQRFLSEHRYSGRRSAADLLLRLNGAPRTALSGDVAETATVAVLSHVATLEPLVAQIRSLTAKIEARLRELPDANILQSFPGSGGVTAAMITAKLGSDRERFQTPEHFDHELREALTCLADNSRKRSVWAADMYRRALERGCDHPHAIRILARAWARVIWKCWRENTPYEPAKHGQAAKLAA